jgi:hypothetical protein
MDDWQPVPFVRFMYRIAWRLYVERTSRGQGRSDKAARAGEAERASVPLASGPAPAVQLATEAVETGALNLVEVGGKTVEMPPGLQSPSLELTAAELADAALVYERSLALLAQAPA